MKKYLILIAALPLIACGDGVGDTSPLTAEEQQARVATADVDFGADNGEWANDDECDDPRFKGPGMTSTPLLDDDIKADATDCRTAYERGELTLIE